MAQGTICIKNSYWGMKTRKKGGYQIVQNKKNDQIVGEITKYDYHQMKCKK